jgi:hypothetical protein
VLQSNETAGRKEHKYHITELGEEGRKVKNGGKRKRGEKKEEMRSVMGGKIEGERKRKGNGKKGKYIRGDKQAGNLQMGALGRKRREEKRNN